MAQKFKKGDRMVVLVKEHISYLEENETDCLNLEDGRVVDLEDNYEVRREKGAVTVVECVQGKWNYFSNNGYTCEYVPGTWRIVDEDGPEES